MNLLTDHQRDNIDWNSTVSDFIQNNEWTITKLASVIDNDTVRKFLAIPIPIHDRDDELIWGPSINGQFTIKSATWLRYDNAPPHDQQSKLNLIWKLNNPPKVKIFGWLLVRGRLRTKDRIMKY